MPQYVLCSSSGEEEAGEVSPETQVADRNIDIGYMFARTLYHRSIYIGRNHKLSSLRLSLSEKKPEYIKNRLKKTPPFSFVMSFISFLDEPAQNLEFYKDIISKNANFMLEGANQEIGKVETIPHCKSFKETYSQVFALVAESNNLGNDFSIKLQRNFNKAILIQDSVMNNLSDLKVPFTVAESRGIKKILFHNHIPEEISLGKAIELYGGFCVCQAASSREIRFFSDQDTILIVFSASVFWKDNREHRIYKNVDLPKNCNVLVEEEGIRVIEDYEDNLSFELGILNGLDLSDGEYFLCKQKIYKISNEDIKEHNSIDYNSIFVACVEP